MGRVYLPLLLRSDMWLATANGMSKDIRQVESCELCLCGWVCPLLSFLSPWEHHASWESETCRAKPDPITASSQVQASLASITWLPLNCRCVWNKCLFLHSREIWWFCIMQHYYGKCWLRQAHKKSFGILSHPILAQKRIFCLVCKCQVKLIKCNVGLLVSKISPFFL